MTSGVPWLVNMTPALEAVRERAEQADIDRPRAQVAELEAMARRPIAVIIESYRLSQSRYRTDEQARVRAERLADKMPAMIQVMEEGR